MPGGHQPVAAVVPFAGQHHNPPPAAFTQQELGRLGNPPASRVHELGDRNPMVFGGLTVQLCDLRRGYNSHVEGTFFYVGRTPPKCSYVYLVYLVYLVCLKDLRPGKWTKKTK